MLHNSIRLSMTTKKLIVVVDDDAILSTSMTFMLEDAGFSTRSYGSSEELLESDWADHAACLLLDENLPGLCGVDALRQLKSAGIRVPVVMITGAGDVPTAVAAMKAGAFDFIEKPASDIEVLGAIERALKVASDGPALDQLHAKASQFIAQLTPRQLQILELIIAGHPNKIIASDLGISQRTVESHRAEIMQIVEIFRARIIDMSDKTFVVEVTGSPDKIDKIHLLLQGHGIKEMTRTGVIAMARGARTA